MECGELRALLLDDVLGQSEDRLSDEAERHLASCQACRDELARLERTWSLLGDDPDAEVTPAFRQRTLQLLEDEMIRGRVRAFQPRPSWLRVLAYAAGLAAAAAGGFWAARQPVVAGRPAAPVAVLPTPPADASGSLSNVTFAPPDASGRIGVSYDVTSHRSLVGRPDDPAVARLLASLITRGAQTSGEKSRAIDLVSAQYRPAQAAPASEDIVRALSATLKNDGNPGVRKKAADALAGLPMTPEIRAAFLEALRSDRNPAIRLIAVEALAAGAKNAPDPSTVESLRQKAADPSENGFVRAKAASALKSIEF
jgi:hypothetical protein